MWEKIDCVEFLRMPSTIGKILVLCDMNGTLLVRSKSKKQFGRVPDLKVDGKFYFVRPGARKLIHMLSHPESGFDFGFYTSMVMRNAEPAAAYLFAAESEGGEAVAVAQPGYNVYDQAYNIFDRQGEKVWGGWKRNLPKVWKSGIAEGHDKRTTVCIDDTPHKMRQFPRNVVVVPEYVPTPESEALDVNDLLGPLFSRLREVWRCQSGQDVRDIIALLGMGEVEMGSSIDLEQGGGARSSVPHADVSVFKGDMGCGDEDCNCRGATAGTTGACADSGTGCGTTGFRGGTGKCNGKKKGKKMNKHNFSGDSQCKTEEMEKEKNDDDKTQMKAFASPRVARRIRQRAREKNGKEGVIQV